MNLVMIAKVECLTDSMDGLIFCGFLHAFHFCMNEMHVRIHKNFVRRKINCPTED